MPEEIDLIARTYDYEKKCGTCGFRTTVLWNLGDDEPEELAACGSCTTDIIASNEKYAVTREDSNAL